MADGFISIGLSTDLRKELNRYLKAKEGKIDRALQTKLKESMEYLRDKIEDLAPEVTGDLKRIISSLPINRSGGARFSITENARLVLEIPLNRKKDQKILWVDRGTGIYGPNRQVIRPVESPFLQFEIGGRIVRSKTIKGQPGQRFIKRAIAVSKLIISSKIRSTLRS